MAQKPPFGTSQVVQWSQVALNLVSMVIALFIFFNAVDKRLTIMETKMEIALRNQSVFVTKDSIDQLVESAKSEHENLQRQIDELKMVHR